MDVDGGRAHREVFFLCPLDAEHCGGPWEQQETLSFLVLTHHLARNGRVCEGVRIVRVR